MILNDFNRLKSSDCEGDSRSIRPRVLEMYRLPCWLSCQRVGLTTDDGVQLLKSSTSGAVTNKSYLGEPSEQSIQSAGLGLLAVKIMRGQGLLQGRSCIQFRHVRSSYTLELKHGRLKIVNQLKKYCSSKASFRFITKYTARPSLWVRIDMALPLPCFFSSLAT